MEAKALHANHHRLIAERIDAWQAAPKRSGLDKMLRREKGKRANWSLKTHLLGQHGKRMPANAKIEDLIAAHDAIDHDGLLP